MTKPKAELTELKYEPVINRSQVKRAVAALEKIAEHLANISLHLYSTQESVSDIAGFVSDSVAVSVAVIKREQKEQDE